MQEIEVTKIVYKSDDGKIFDNQLECKIHERKYSLNKVYLVYEIKRHDKIENNVEIYSTYALAKNSLKHVNIKDTSDYKILEMYVDEIER